MVRLLRLTLGLALCMALMGSRCDDVEAVPPEVLRWDVAPPFDYGLYSDAQGRLVGETSGVLLVHRSAHLERVYSDSAAGNARARMLVRQLEGATEAAGVGLADRALSLGCTALPTCTVRWKVDVSRIHLVYDGRLVSEEAKKILRKELGTANVELHFHEK